MTQKMDIKRIQVNRLHPCKLFEIPENELVHKKTCDGIFALEWMS